MMKTIKILTMTLLFAFQAVACSGGDKVITVEALPAAAQTLIGKYFGGKQVSLVKKDKEGLKTYYDVVMADGVKLEFDQSGAWTDVDCKNKAVPAAIVPEAIGQYVADNYASLTIVQIERENYGYDIELSNGLDIRFDRDYNVTRVGD